MAYLKRKSGDTSQARAERIAKKFGRPGEAVSVPMNNTLRAASVPGEENPLILVAHVDTPALELLEQARRLCAGSRFADEHVDLEWDPS